MKFQISSGLDDTLKKLDGSIREQMFKKISRILRVPELGKPLE